LLRLTTVFSVVCIAAIAEAATFVVPPDREMIRRADAIVIATPTLSYSQVTKDGIETVTRMSVDDVLKGTAPNDALNVVEPGGQIGELFSYVAGAPRFDIGERVLLFLTRTGPDRWSATDLVLGKFSFTTDEKGERLLARDAEEIVGWDPDLSVHRERARAEDAFLRFVREEVAARHATEDYFVDTTPATRTRTGRFSAIANATFTATSYTMTISGSQGSRWNVFPSGVTFYAGASGEPGAPGNGTTAVQAAIASWDNDPGSNINYVYGGTDSTHTQGLHATDGANTVLFERDLSSWGVSPFTCTANSYSGTLGLGGITSATGTHTLGSETFVTTREGDVEMNRGLANCTLLFNNGDFNSAVAHEVGHTLGFRHSDQTRNSGGACTTDPTLECSNQAIMKSFVSQGLNATLQAWDQHAAAAVYPGSSSTCTPPTITTQPQSRTITAGQSVTLTASASGTAPLNYQWYQGISGSTNSLVLSSGTSITVSPTTTTTYWLRVTNSCGRADSVTVTITVNPAGCAPPSITTQPQSQTITAGQSVTLTASASGTAPLNYQWYQGISGSTNSLALSTGPSITVAPTTTTNYWLRVSNSCGRADSVTGTITVNAACTPPTITTQPQSQTINPGQAVTLTATASGTAPLNYQWYQGISGSTNSLALSSGSSITVAPTVTTTYWLRVTSSCGKADSVTVTITVNGCTRPTINTLQPQSQTITAGQSVTITATASGTAPLNYRWYQGISGSTNSLALSAGSSITVAPTTTTKYWLRVTNSCGFADSVTVTITVN